MKGHDKMNDEVILLMKDKSIKTVKASKLLRKNKNVEIALLQIGTEIPIYLAINAKDIPEDFTPCDVGYTLSAMKLRDIESPLINATDSKYVILHCNTFVDYLRFIVSACKINETREFAVRGRKMGYEDYPIVLAMTNIDIKINGEVKSYQGNNFLSYCSKAQGWNKHCLSNIIEAWYDKKNNSYMKMALNFKNESWRYIRPSYDVSIHKVNFMINKDEAIGIYSYSSYGYVFLSYDEWKLLSKIAQADLQISVYVIKGDDDSYESDKPVSVYDISTHPEYFFVTDYYRAWIKNSLELINYLASINSIMNVIRLTHNIAGETTSDYRVTLTSSFIMYTTKSFDHIQDYFENPDIGVRDNRFVMYSTTMHNDERAYDNNLDNISECCRCISKHIK